MATILKKRTAYKILVWKPLGKKPEKLRERGG
jgi:hypothetical protein